MFVFAPDGAAGPVPDADPAADEPQPAAASAMSAIASSPARRSPPFVVGTVMLLAPSCPEHSQCSLRGAIMLAFRARRAVRGNGRTLRKRPGRSQPASSTPGLAGCGIVVTERALRWTWQRTACPYPPAPGRFDVAGATGANETAVPYVVSAEESSPVRQAGMGKAERNRRQSARERIAAQQAAARRAERRRQLLLTGGSVLAVVAIVVAFVVVKTLGGTASADLLKKVTSVPASTLDSIGKGTANPKAILPISGTPLTRDGKPEVLYMGALYCPFCATERWAMAVALSRFGTLSGVKFIHSSANDTPASIPTMTFYKAGYTSKYISFTAVEMQDVNRATLQAPTAAQNAVLTKYDAPPQVPSSEAGSIPFIDFGNKFLASGASYSYPVLQDKSYAQIAAALA